MKPTCPICPIIDSSAFFDVLLVMIICCILADHSMNLCSERFTVNVLKLKCHPRIIFVSDNPPSAANLSFAIIGSWGIGLFLSFGWAATSIASGIAASSHLHSLCLVVQLLLLVDVNVRVSSVADGDVHD
jgi:hypothetical protein